MKELWLMRRGATMRWALFRQNGDGTMRVTLIESDVRASDLASIQRNEAGALFVDLRRKGFEMIPYAHARAAGMTPFRLLKEVQAIAGATVKRGSRASRAIKRAAHVVVVVKKRRT